MKPLLFLLLAGLACAQTFDVVIQGGRVIDPESKLDAIRNVGIINNRIAQISSEPLKGKEAINVSGLVVAPGFIDMHVHGRSNVFIARCNEGHMGLGWERKQKHGHHYDRENGERLHAF